MCICHDSPSELKKVFDAAKNNVDPTIAFAVMKGLALHKDIMYRAGVLALRRAWVAYKPFYGMAMD